MADLDKKKGGPVTAVLGLAEAQLSAGHQVCVAATDRGWDGDDRGVPTKLFPCRDPRWRFSPSMRGGLAGLLEAHDIAHLHGLWDFPIWAAASACRHAGTPYCLTLHGMLNKRSLSHRAWRKRVYMDLASAGILKHAGRLHFTSEQERDNLPLREFLGKAFVCPFGVDAGLTPADPDSFRRRHSLSKDDRVVLFLGRLHPQKRPHLLVEAFETVLAQLPGARLVFAGDGEKVFVRELMAFAGERARDRIIFTGPLDRSEVANAYATSAVFVLPSLEESLGLSVLEAMAAGRPVIVTPEVGLAGLIEASGAGIVCTANALAMGCRLVALLQDDGLRARMADNGRELVRSHFAWETVERRMESEYRNIIAARHGS